LKQLEPKSRLHSSSNCTDPSRPCTPQDECRGDDSGDDSEQQQPSNHGAMARTCSSSTSMPSQPSYPPRRPPPPPAVCSESTSPLPWSSAASAARLPVPALGDAASDATCRDGAGPAPGDGGRPSGRTRPCSKRSFACSRRNNRSKVRRGRRLVKGKALAGHSYWSKVTSAGTISQAAERETRLGRTMASR
jgi:hypothetical protein